MLMALKDDVDIIAKRVRVISIARKCELDEEFYDYGYMGEKCKDVIQNEVDHLIVPLEEATEILERIRKEYYVGLALDGITRGFSG